MAAGISRPDVWLGIALNRDPNDPNTPSSWTSLQSSDLQVFAVTGEARGRDYELAQPMAADPVVAVRDVNEYLNPENTSSPYYGLIKPYREIAAVCQWPIAASGGNNNLINTFTWRGSGVDGYDPSFDAYATGFAAPNWINRYGLVTAIIASTNPFQGSRHVRYDVAATLASQGVGFGVPVIPGRQYTSSLYVSQTTASRQQIFVEGLLAGADLFRRTTVNGQGSPESSYSGGAYSTSGGAAADYQVSPGTATQIAATTNVTRATLLPDQFHDSEQTIPFTVPALATGDFYRMGLASRWVDASNFYRATATFFPDGSASIVIDRILAGVLTQLSSFTLPIGYAAGDRFTLSFTTSGSNLEAHIWPAGRNEALFFQTQTSDTSTALRDSGLIGFVSSRGSANTNANLPCTFNSYAAYGSIAGNSTVATAAYVRLSVTYNANQLSQPAACNATALGKPNRGLVVTVRTVGVAVAGTISVDAIQHEQGAAASTFVTAGPNVFPLFRNYAERYPRTWRAKGYEGVVGMPCVDALALLNKIFVSNPADQAFANAQPDLYYALAGGTDSTLFPDTSGNSGPALREIVGKLNAGAIAPGTAIPIVGDPNAVGVQFTPVTGPPTGGNLIGTGTGSTGVGTDVPGTPFAMPSVVSIPWQMSLGGWFVSTANGSAQSLVRVFGRAFSVSLQIQSSGNMLMFAGIPGTAFFTTVTVPFPVSDGQPHYAMGTLTMDGTNTTISCYVDSGGPVSSTVATSTLGGLIRLPMNTIQIGGVQSDFTSVYGTILNGTAAKIGIWRRALSAGEILTIYLNGQFGLNGESSGARELRHLQEGPYNGPTRITQETPSTLQTGMGIPSFDGTIDLLTDSLNTMQAEQGMLWAQPDGVLAFEGRQQRWLRTASSNTFGEDAASGELPYQDGIVFDPDPTYVYPVVTWTRNGGITALGGLPIDRQQAAAASFPREFTGNNDLFDDTTAQNISDWIFYTHRAALTRVAEVEIDMWGAQSTPWSMWTTALRLEVGQRVTAVRRVKSANNGAGLTVALPCFIERIGTPSMSFVMGQERWTITMQLSPVGTAPGSPTVQPWVLEHSVYGLLGLTTVLGW